MTEEKIDVEKYLQGVKDSDYHKISFEEMEKIIRTTSDKTYFNQKLIEDEYIKIEKFLLELRKKGKLTADELSDIELE